MNRRVVVTGIGIVCPLGTTTDEVWNNCLDGVSIVAPIPSRWERYADYKSRIWAPLPKIDYVARGLSRIETLQNDPFTMLAAIAAHESLSNARLNVTLKNKRQNSFVIEGVDPIRAGVYLGTGVGGAHTFLSNHSHQVLSRQKQKLSETFPLSLATVSQSESLQNVMDALAHPSRFNPFVVSMLMPNAASAMLGIKFSCHGPNTTFGVACAASTVAIGKAFRSIQYSEVDLALAGGAEYLYDEYGGIFQGFDIANTLAHGYEEAARANRPFDARHCGFLFAEGGAAVLVLEELERAVNRDAPIIAEITGFSESFDAYSMMSIAPDTSQIERMLTSALLDADLTPRDIQYVNAHGTATEKNDTMECQAIARVFGKDVLVNSTKSLTGHLIGASGAIEAAVTALSLKHQRTHTCRNLDQPIADLNFVRSTKTREIRAGVTQSFAFGGHNAALVLKEHTTQGAN